LQTQHDLHLQAGDGARIGDAQVGGALDALAQGRAGGGDLRFDGKTQVAGTTTLAAARDVNVTGTLASGKALALDAQRDANVSGTLAGGATLALDAQRDVNVSGTGTVQSGGDQSIVAHAGSVSSQGTLTGATKLTVSAGQDVA
ncbi:hypothetical protein NCPPB3923_30240, partial [Burkholderia glumae]